MNGTITKKEQIDIIDNLNQEINRLDLKLKNIKEYQKYKKEFGLDLNNLVEKDMTIDDKIDYIKDFIGLKTELDNSYGELENLKRIKNQKIELLKTEIFHIDNFKNLDNFLNNFNQRIELFSEKYNDKFEFINYYRKHEKEIKRPILFFQEGLDNLKEDIIYYKNIINDIEEFENLIGEINIKDDNILSLEVNIVKIINALEHNQKRRYKSKLQTVLNNLEKLKDIDIENNLGEVDNLLHDIQKDFLDIKSRIKDDIQREYRRYSRRGNNRPTAYFNIGDVLNISRPHYTPPVRIHSSSSGGWSSGSSSSYSFSGSSSYGGSSGGSSW